MGASQTGAGYRNRATRQLSECQSGVLVQPLLDLTERHQHLAADPHDAKPREDVFVQEVPAHAEGLGSLTGLRAILGRGCSITARRMGDSFTGVASWAYTRIPAPRLVLALACRGKSS